MLVSRQLLIYSLLFVYSLHMSAAAASRDVTLFHAHNLLHKHDYNISDALKALVPTTGKIASQQKKRKKNS